jgi:arylsulfatase A-like enzyme
MLDLLPTVFDLYDIDSPASFVGTSLLPLIEGGDGAHRIAFSESTLYSTPKQSLRDGNFTYVVEIAADKAIHEALYDWQSDPLEMHNQIADRPADADAMRARYRDFLEVLTRDAAETKPGSIVDMAPGQLDQLRESLESLGYVGRDEEGYVVDPVRN